MAVCPLRRETPETRPLRRPLRPDCLSAVDARIAAAANKATALKTHKKGLMQQLFPSPEGD